MMRCTDFSTCEKWLLLLLTLLYSVQGQTLAQDCTTVNTIWRKLNQTTSIPSNCCNATYGITCSTTRVQSINWSNKNLVGPIPTEFGLLTGLKTLLLMGNKLNGVIPESMASLTSLTTWRMGGNHLAGPLPSWIGNLTALTWFGVAGNWFNGTIPSTLGNLKNLIRLNLSNNKFTGSIPDSFGNLRALTSLWIQGNQLSRHPLSLTSLNASIIVHPNPLYDVPYNVVKPASIGVLSGITLANFIQTDVISKKRQVTANSVTLSDLLAMCPLSNVTSADVPAGCIAGVYNTYCTNPANATLLMQCQNAYNQAFAASIFSSLGAVCPAWKKGPRSAACSLAVATYSYNYTLGYDATSGKTAYLLLNSTQAAQLVSNILGSPKYAPCPYPAPTCNW